MTIRHNIGIKQGATWSMEYTHLDSLGVAFDLTGYTARMAIRTDYGSGLEAYLSTGADADGGTIVLGDALGTITLSMTAVESAALGGNIDVFAVPTIPVGSTIPFIYDCEIVSAGGVVTRVLEGKVSVYREVTT